MAGGWSLTEELRRQNRAALREQQPGKVVPFGFNPRATTQQIRLDRTGGDASIAGDRQAGRAAA